MGKKLIILALILFLIIIILNYLSDTFNYGLRGKYYAGSKWEGEPLLERIDPEIDCKWDINYVYSHQPPPLNSPPFSVEWEGYLYVDKEGDYSFATKSDDGSFLYINDNLIINNGGVHEETYIYSSLSLKKGFHPIKIKYFDIGIQGKMVLYWTPPLSKEAIIPFTNLFLAKNLYFTDKVDKYRKAISQWLKILKGLLTSLLILIFSIYLIRRITERSL